MIEKYLFIVEGEKTEKTIFGDFFESLGFNIVNCKEKMTNDYDIVVSEEEYVNGVKNIVLIQGPRNRIHDILLNNNVELSIDNINIETVFGFKPNDFIGIFWIYDVDHNGDEDIIKMFEKFNDENGNGLLLLSSPCIEVLGSFDDTKEFRGTHLKKYKALLNKYYDSHGFGNVEKYIINNFYKCLLHFLDKNYIDFEDSNIMNHPYEIIEFINKNNTRIHDDNSVCYRYFSTVVYCAIAYVLGYTKKIDNYNDFKNYLESKIK